MRREGILSLLFFLVGSLPIRHVALFCFSFLLIILSFLCFLIFGAENINGALRFSFVF